MHSYLKSVGFSQIRKREEMRDIIHEVVRNYDEKLTLENYEDGVFAEFVKYYGESFGIIVCGEFDENNKFYPEYSFPFFKGTGVSTQEKVVVERHADKESYAGACDDLRVGVTLIFYLQNAAQYMITRGKNQLSTGPQALTLSALASEGMILLPVEKDKEAVRVDKEQSRNRSHLIEAARNGDEEAMESLTMEEMDTYTILSQRIVNDDIFTIVDTYFMPYGIECDQYKVLGEIVDYSIAKNSKTQEEIVQMRLESNDLQYDVCINRKDLLGEPQVGRRFKGNLWLQGQLHL